MDSIIREAMNLKAAGVKELLVISQDTAAYGVDKRYKLDFACGRPVHTKLIDLCRELGRLDLWTRLHYVYPYPHVDDIVPLMAEGLILPYLDVPFQHAHPRILKLMKRPACGEKNLERIAAWRRACPDITIRSTFIVGFPERQRRSLSICSTSCVKRSLTVSAALLIRPSTERLPMISPARCPTKCAKSAAAASWKCRRKFRFANSLAASAGLKT